jgi:hypothetical protein
MNITANNNKSGIMTTFNTFRIDITDFLSESQRRISLIASKTINSTDTLIVVIDKENIIIINI